MRPRTNSSIHGALLSLSFILPCVVGALAAEPPKPQNQEKQIDIRTAGRPLSEIANRITQTSGSVVSVDDAVKEWKATIGYRGNTNRLLRDLCDNLGLQLVRAADSNGTFRYRIALPTEQRRRLEAHYAARERQRRNEQAADGAALERAINELLRNPSGIPDAPNLKQEGKPLVRLLGTLGPEAVRRLSISKRTTPGGGMDKTPSLVLPVSNLSPAQRSLVRQSLEGHLHSWKARSPGATNVSWLTDGLRRLDGSQLGFWTFNTSGVQILHMSVRFPGMAWTPDFPILQTYSAAGGRTTPDNSGNPQRQNANLRSSSGVNSPSDPRETRQVDLRAGEREYSEAVLEIARASQLNVIADFFTLRERFPQMPNKTQLRVLLDRLGTTFQVDRKWKDGTLSIRSRQWEDRLEQEPTALVLDRLVSKAREQPFLSERELAFAAARLREPQVRGLSNWHDRGRHLRAEAAAISRNYSVYSWVGRLSDAQWQGLTGTGLPLRSLKAQQTASLAALFPNPPDRQKAATIHWRQENWKYPPAIVLELRDRAKNLVADAR